MRRYISENGTDSDQCGQTAKTACKTVTPLLEQSHRDNPFVDPDLLQQVQNVWGQILNQFPFYLGPEIPPDFTQICTKEQTMNYNFFDDTCNLIKDIYLSRILSYEDRDHFNSSLDNYCIYRRSLYEFYINCSSPLYSYIPEFGEFIFLGIRVIEQTRDEMIEKLKSINVNILTLTSIKIYNEVFPAVGPFIFITTSSPQAIELSTLTYLTTHFTMYISTWTTKECRHTSTSKITSLQDQELKYHRLQVPPINQSSSRIMFSKVTILE